MSDPHFSLGILFNMDHRLLGGRGTDHLVQISGRIPMQSAEADINCSHSLYMAMCSSTESKRGRSETAEQINSGKTPDKCLLSLKMMHVFDCKK